MKRLALFATLLAFARPVLAASDDDEEESSDDEEADSSDDEEATPKPKAKAKAKANDDEEDDDTPVRQKQNLTGHDLGTNKKTNEFEKDRFFVDKVDTEKTEEGTLVQGSLTTSAFMYTESGGNYAGTMVPNAGAPSRMFGDMRLQTDFRHIKASRWEARLDARVRFVNTPANYVIATTTSPSDPNHVQSGLTGTNEYDIRELWLIRSGARSDVFLGRQFIPDLGGIKIDGLRIDYASSRKFTLLFFGGMYPLRGSRSITTDYSGVGKTGAGGFGAAYRTDSAYGAIGGVVLAPFPQTGAPNEQPRIYATSNGYLRSGPKLDVYHFGLIDLFGSAGFQLTNLSGGINYKPSQRLRLTASFNRVDTETLAIQARAFLDPLDAGAPANVVQNEAIIVRLATNTARAGVSAGLGPLQRFEISTAISYRLRPAFELPTGDMRIKLDAASSVEVWGSIVDRHSIKDARIGIDASQTFGVGNIAYQRNKTFGLRTFIAHDIKDGRGEWELEVAYAKSTDTPTGACDGTIQNCFGTTQSSMLSLGGQLYYRINANWLGLGNLYMTRTDATRVENMMASVDPTITSITGFGRLAYRF